MRNRDVIGFRKLHGFPVDQTKELTSKLEAATKRLHQEEAAYFLELEEQLRAAEKMLKAQEKHAVASARVDQLRNRRQQD